MDPARRRLLRPTTPKPDPGFRLTPEARGLSYPNAIGGGAGQALSGMSTSSPSRSWCGRSVLRAAYQLVNGSPLSSSNVPPRWVSDTAGWFDRAAGWPPSLLPKAVPPGFPPVPPPPPPRPERDPRITGICRPRTFRFTSAIVASPRTSRRRRCPGCTGRRHRPRTAVWRHSCGRRTTFPPLPFRRVRRTRR